METLINADTILRDRMTSYSAYVLLHRAIPDYRDGLKPSARRILYSMHKHNTYNFTKSATAASRIMLIHPHGTLYPSIVGLAQKDKHLHPFIEGKGNFGQYTSRDLQAAADRYTEVKLSKIAKASLQNFDKNIVDFEPNYDGTQMVPEVLPVKYPVILSQSQKGIGVGFSSSTPSYNLKELCQATINVIDGKSFYLVPDFATGGFIRNDVETFNQIIEEGKGSIDLRAKYEISGNEIIITEIPYGVKREKIIEEVVAHVKSGKIQEVKSIDDLTGLKGMKIVITIKKGQDAEVVMQKLFKLTSLQSKFNINFNILIDEKLKVVGVKYVLEKWVEWRKECVRRCIESDVKTLSRKVHLLEGLEKILLDIDLAIDLIRNTKASDIIQILSDQFKIDEEQSKEVLRMQLKNINKDFLKEKIKEIESVKKELELMKFYLADDKSQLDIVKKGLLSIMEEFGIDRRTQVIEFVTSKKVERVLTKEKEERLNEEFESVVVTKNGFVYKNKTHQENNIAADDSVVSIINNITNADYISIIFKKSTESLQVKISDIPLSAKNSLGTHINSVSDKFKNETVAIAFNPNEKDSNVLYIFKNGKALKTSVANYKTSRKILKNAKCDLEIEYTDIIESEYDISIKPKNKSKSFKINTQDIVFKKSRNSVGAYIKNGIEIERVKKD